jgi:hypothetical protein
MQDILNTGKYGFGSSFSPKLGLGDNAAGVTMVNFCPKLLW